MSTDRQIDTLLIHCAAVPNGRWTTVEDIDGWHRAAGFRRTPLTAAARSFNPHLKSIGYHFVVYANGAIATGRHPSEIGAHARGYNARSIGICLVGTDAYSLEQWRMLAELVTMLSGRYKVPLQSASAASNWRGVCGHRDTSPDRNGNGVIERTEWVKTCPGFSVADWLAGGMLALEGHIHG